MNITNPNANARQTTDISRTRSHVIEPGRSLFQQLIATDARFAPTIARLGLGLVILPHALQKTLGWFGGYGFSGTLDSFRHQLGLPAPVAAFAIGAELVGALLLVFGFMTRLGAIAIIGMMLGAISIVHLPHGFFMNWYGKAAGEGFEYHLLAITLGLVTLVAGGGRASADRALMTRRRAEDDRRSIVTQPE